MKKRKHQEQPEPEPDIAHIGREVERAANLQPAFGERGPNARHHGLSRRLGLVGAKATITLGKIEARLASAAPPEKPHPSDAKDKEDE